MYWGDPYMADMVITNPNHWMCSGTNLKLNDRLPQLIGYEVDSVTNSSPVNIDVLGHSPVGTGYADTSTYIAASGAVVFASASNQWSWGLDNYNATGASPLRAAIANAKVKQMTSNLLARMLGRRLPVASAGGPYTGKVGTAVAFNGSSSSDADGTIVSYAWTFSDGATETGPTPSHKFSAAGTYEVNLVVIDDMDAAHSSSTSVTIGTGEPALSAPSELVAQSDSGNSGHVLLTWVDNSDNEQLFRIERSLLADTGFAPIDQVKANVTSYTDKATDKGVLYYYRVQAVNETTVSAFSNIASLVTSGGKNGKREAAQSTEGKQDSRVGVEASELNLRALPNPSNGAFNVQIQSPVADKINLRVVDAQGRVVDQLNRMQPNQVIKIGETYRPGVYFMEAQQGAKKVLLKLVKVAN